MKALDDLRKRESKFDYIFIDPPYHDTLPHRILGDVAHAEILAEDGWIIYEAARKTTREILESVPDKLYPLREVEHGGTALLFFRWRHDELSDV